MENFAKKKTLEDYVNEVDYHYLNHHYVPSREAIEMVNFIKLVNGKKGEENKTPVMHFMMLDDLIHKRNNLFVVHRGGAKTTVIHEYTFLYMAVFGTFFEEGEVSVAIYVSDTMENGVKNMREQLEFRWRESEFLQQYVPEAKFTDDRWEFTNINGKKLFIKGFAAMTGVRGFKKYGQRPTWCGFDDLMSDKNAKSPTILEDIENVIYKAAMEALHPTKRKIVWTGTPFSKKDSLYKAAASGSWNVRAFPLCEKFPCTEEEFQGSWPDRFTYASTKENYEGKMMNGKVQAFNQELMLRVTSEDDRLILDSDIQWFNRKALLVNRAAYNFYITTDFATSDKQSADYSVISVWAYNNKGYWFLVDGVCKRQTMDKNIDDLFRLAQAYQPQSVGVEVTGQQGGFIKWIQQEMLSRNIWFALASDNNSKQPGIRPNTNKLQRFNTVVPMFKAGTIFLPEEWRHQHELVRELEEEITNVTPAGFLSAHDDAADTVSMLSVLRPWKPSESSPMKRTGDDNVIWQDIAIDEDDGGYIGSYIV